MDRLPRSIEVDLPADSPYLNVREGRRRVPDPLAAEGGLLIRRLTVVSILLGSLVGPRPGSGAIETCTGYNWSREYRYAAGSFPYSLGGAVVATPDGGAVMTGVWSVAGMGGEALFVMRTDPRGEILWHRAYAAEVLLFPSPIDLRADGGLFVGATLDRSLTDDRRPWILSLDPLGQPIWQRSIRTDTVTYLEDLDATADGGLVFTGEINLAAGQPNRLWVVKVDAAGRIEWQKSYGGGAGETGVAIRQTADGGYFVAGMTWSFGSGEGDAWVLRLDGAGKVKWERAIGGPAGDLLTAVLPLEDGGAIVVGRSDSFPADVWIIRIDPAGRVVWERTYGGEGRVWVEAIAPAAAGGFVFGGVTIPGGVPANQERWLVRIDEAGAILWQKAYPSGPSYLDEVYGLAPIPGGGYYLSGASAWSEGWELVDSAATLMRLDPAGDISAGCESVLRTDRVAKVVESRLVETTATVADTAATSTDSAFTPVAIGSRVSEPCAGLLPPQEISGPGAAHPLLFTHNTGLAWEPAAAGGACVFNLYRGVVSELPAGRYGKCLAPGLTVSAATDGETPPSGEAFLYLVTGLNRAGEGSAGSDSAGIPITGLLPCP